MDMQFEAYLRTLQKWWWLIVACTLCAGTAGFAASSLTEPVYEASVKLMSNQSANTGIVDYPSLLGSQQIIETSRELLQTKPVLEAVVRNLNLTYSVEELAERVKVDVIPDTQLLRLTVEDTNPQRAAGIANEIAQTFLYQRSTGRPDLELETYEQSVVNQMRALQEAIESTETEIARLHRASDSESQDRLTALQAQQSQQRAAYADFLSQYLNIRSMKSRSLELTIVEPARVPTEPVRPRRALATAVAAGGGLALACGMAFLLHYLSDTFDGPNEMQEELSLPSLGAIPTTKSRQRNGVVRVEEDAWPTLEAFRILRTNIQFASVDGEIRTLLITSPGPREGKTSIVANLGVVAAQGGRTVLLVDADLRQPRLHQAFELNNRRGLTDLLVEGGDQADYILDTKIENLYLLPSGSVPPNPSGLLGSERMAELAQDFAFFADLVLFDAPPVLVGADAMLLASQMDGVLLLVDGSSTRPEAAKRALKMLQNAQARVLGAVLNRAHIVHSDYYYYYSNRKEPKSLLQGQWDRLQTAIMRRIPALNDWLGRDGS